MGRSSNKWSHQQKWVNTLDAVKGIQYGAGPFNQKADTLAPSNLNLSVLSAGEAAENAASKKIAKYSSLSDHYKFVPVAFETLGPPCQEGTDFIKSIGSRLRATTGDIRETSFLWQRLSVAIQRFNAICIRGTFEALQDASWF